MSLTTAEKNIIFAARLAWKNSRPIQKNICAPFRRQKQQD
jgi:hypothetical protein